MTKEKLLTDAEIIDQLDQLIASKKKENDAIKVMAEVMKKKGVASSSEAQTKSKKTKTKKKY